MLGFATSYWSSTEYNNNNAWYQNFTNGTQNNNNKNNANSVRCIRKSINTLIPMITLEDVFQAYYDCRRNKSRTNNALVFELDYEARLIQLYEDIITGRYHIGRSIAFIVFSPSIREVFAADFRDRIVHHLIYNKINPYFEKTFIYDSYSCRV